MKKYLAIFAVLFTVIVSSCSNDDIPVTHATTFKVDPSTVISSYEEFYVGDLTSFNSKYQLRVRLLVYNDHGILVESGEKFSPDYTHVQTFEFNLSEGDYTTVAITDVVGKTSSDVVEFYTLSNQERLNTTTITHAGYIGGQYAILGLTAEKQVISSYTRDVNIKVKPAGALIVCYISDWNACLDYDYLGEPIDVEQFVLWGNQTSSDLTLNNFGEPHYSIESSQDYDWIWYMHERDSEYSSGYSYCFKFPMKNVKLMWNVYTATSVFMWGEPAVLDIEAGKEYLFVLDVANDEASWYDLNVSANAPVMRQSAKPTLMRNMNFDMKLEKAPVSVKAVSYLK